MYVLLSPRSLGHLTRLVARGRLAAEMRTVDVLFGARPARQLAHHVSNRWQYAAEVGTVNVLLRPRLLGELGFDVGGGGGLAAEIGFVDVLFSAGGVGLVGHVGRGWSVFGLAAKVFVVMFLFSHGDRLW